MKSNEMLAGIAFGIGFIQMYRDYMRSDEMDEKSRNGIRLALFANCLWLIYQYREHGANFSVMYTVLAIFLQLYLLNKILVKENEKNEDKIQ
jgi:hypothetical protein